MKRIITTLLSFSLVFSLFANNPTRVQQVLNWSDAPVVHLDAEGNPLLEIWRFSGAVYDEQHPNLPYYSLKFPVEGPGRLQVRISNTQYETIDLSDAPNVEVLSEDLTFITGITQERRNFNGNVRFIPIRQTGTNSFERLSSFELEVDYFPAPFVTPPTRGGNTYNSILKEGDIYKVSVSQTGIHRMDYNFLKDELNIDVDNIDPKKLRLYGNGGGKLPEQVADTRYDDLEENAIFVAGEADGSFDPGDYILFYGQGPSIWVYNSEQGNFDFQMNTYDTRNFYFLKVDANDGLRVSEQSSIDNVNYTTTSFDAFLRYEEDKVNLLNDYDLAQGSGQRWFGDYYKNQQVYTYNNFNFPNLITSEPVQVITSFAARSNSSTKFTVKVGGQTFESTNIPAVSTTNSNALFANIRNLNQTFTATGGNLPVTVEYQQNGEGWLDYIQLNARRELAVSGDQMRFRDTRTLEHAVSEFVLTNAGNVTVWDITDPLKPQIQGGSQNGSTFTFGAQTDLELKEFIAFSANGQLTPGAVGKVTNQNLHGIDQVDMVIIYHESLEGEAQRLADHRASHSGLDVAGVRIDQLYNEFSSGRQDPTAIRDFAKMIYDRTDRFRYLLLFGDASYDFRNIEGQGNNLVATYETWESLNPILAFPSDDYFGLLSDSEGTLNSNDDLDIAIGRLPVRDLSQAADVVDKIINYDTSPATLGDWRNRAVFIGDDEDGGIHSRDSDGIAETVGERYPNINLDKIYVDAFNQVATPGGQRVPNATASLNNNMFKGVLAVTYLGHGGAKGWAQERILQIPDISSWTNFDKLPIFITATCSFSGYDDPGFTTAGEQVLLNRRGGASALYTTVRAVYASTNEALTRAATDTLFQKVDGKGQAIGEALRVAKNKSNGGSNSRKFVLLGDPSMLLAIPQYQVATTKINGIEVGSGQLDTIRALQKVTVEGEVRDNGGALLENFNGTLYPTIFDKKVSRKTLGNGTPVMEYDLQKSTLFKGRASVTNGKFTFTFVVPKDINFDFGNGKISYYAEDGVSKDAAGNFDGLIIGGTDAGALSDDQGPKVDVYMNNIDFVFGGLTSENPTLLVLLEDDNGINVVGNSIGHDLTGVLDENTQNTYLLNDFYEAALDDYTRGEVRYPLAELEDGRHEIRVKAWDVANNSAEGYTEFVVAGSGEVALDHVLNYPNPFINSTCFQFEHNMENQELDVQIHIFTVSGRLVKTLEERIISEGSRLSLGNCIQWDGRDNFGDPLAKGVYLYKVKVRAVNTGTSELNGESDFEKLVILR